ncbi:MAG: class I adenylate-forming enzyme family protein [Acidobacteriota bacterium]
MTESLSARLHRAIAFHAAAGREAFSGPEPVTYAELERLISGYAAGVRNWGVVRGETLGIVAPKVAQAIAAYFGALQAGACVCFIDPGLAIERIAEQLDLVDMRRLVVDESLIDRFDREELRGLAVRALRTLDAGGSFIDSGLGSEDRAMLLFTSGSTGRPKGVVLRHGSLICNADGVLGHTGTSPNDRLLHVMPLYHTNGVNNQLIVPLLAGASVILLDRFRPEATLEALRHDAPTYMTGVPTIYARMLPHLTSGERFPSLRFLRCGSAPITAALHEQIEEAFGVPLVVSYGLSEATCTSTMNPPDRRKIGTIGTVLAGQEIRLFDPITNAEVVRGGEGEIRIAGPALMAGYLGSAEQPIVDGWLRTGDLGRFDLEGFLSITGRIKDVINRGGENLSPALIERHLSTHPTIRDCCVVGASDDHLGEVPIAFVVLRDGEVFDEAGLKAFVNSSLGRIYVPAEIRRLDALPINGVGKIDRNLLRNLPPNAKGILDL